MQASSAPYFVGTKNGLVVTWLTNVNLSLLLDGPKTPLVPPPLVLVCAAAVVVVLLLLEPPHAARMVAARPAAPPVSAVRRLNAFSFECGVSSSLPSIHSRRSIASCTGSSSDTGLLLFVGALLIFGQHSLLTGGNRRPGARAPV